MVSERLMKRESTSKHVPMTTALTTSQEVMSRGFLTERAAVLRGIRSLERGAPEPQGDSWEIESNRRAHLKTQSHVPPTQASYQGDLPALPETIWACFSKDVCECIFLLLFYTTLKSNNTTLEGWCHALSPHPARPAAAFMVVKPNSFSESTHHWLLMMTKCL